MTYGMDAPFGFKSAYGTQNVICSLHSTAIKSLQKKNKKRLLFYGQFLIVVLIYIYLDLLRLIYSNSLAFAYFEDHSGICICLQIEGRETRV